MSFAHPLYLLLCLLVLPESLIAAFRLSRWRASLLALSGPARRARSGRVFTACSVAAAGSAALFIMSAAFALSGPSWGTHASASERSGLEAGIVLDVSRSMEAADGSPTRLAAAADLIRDLLRNRSAAGGALSFSLIATKGQAVLLVPLTEDMDSVDSALDYANPDTITAHGTDLQAGLERGIASLGPAAGRGASRFILLFTDGGELSASARDAAAGLRAAGIRLLVVGMGGPSPRPVPGPDGTPLLDSRGVAVSSALDARRLRDLAQTAGGRYFEGSDPATPAGLERELSEGMSSGRKLSYDGVDRSPLFAALALLFLFATIIAESLGVMGARP